MGRRLSAVDKLKLERLSENNPSNGTEHPKSLRAHKKFDKFRRKITIPHPKPARKQDIDPNYAYPDPERSTGLEPKLDIRCGPLLRFVYTDFISNPLQPQSLYTLLIVTHDLGSDYSISPFLAIIGLYVNDKEDPSFLASEKIHQERGLTFWRWKIYLVLSAEERRISYSINGSKEDIAFHIPSSEEPMRLVFHTCNGFSQGIDPSHFNGPDPMWRDVLRHHSSNPWHAMLGGGDQLYCDGMAKKSRRFQEWLRINNLHRKFMMGCDEGSELRNEMEEFFLEHYCQWFHQGQFSHAAAQIPMINIWDDHDIIDGFGSYPRLLMSSPVFSAIGKAAFKYYLLFQHQTSSEEGMWGLLEWDKSVIFGVDKGPYIGELSRSFLTPLGRDVLFLGVDNRMERTRHKVNHESTYQVLFQRLNETLGTLQPKHLIIMLGIPIAYPRLVWLEKILTSRLVTPIKLLARMGMFSNLLNRFDRRIEILDDLDDHWTAKHHKKERNRFIEALQKVALRHSVRISILGGDAHMAAVGRFYTKGITADEVPQDHRYILNVISSAIVNTPPAESIGDILNKVHHLNYETDEDMIPLFDEDVDGKKLHNTHLMPRRNWCGIQMCEGNKEVGSQKFELEFRLNVERDRRDAAGTTKGYYVKVPALTVEKV